MLAGQEGVGKYTDIQALALLIQGACNNTTAGSGE